MTHTKNNRGFTLVELLVVVSIMVLLMSLLLPALNGARREARKVSCASNMRQIGIALYQYTDEFNGVMPYCSIKYTDVHQVPWDTLLYRYLGKSPDARISQGDLVRPLTYDANNVCITFNYPPVLKCPDDYFRDPWLRSARYGPAIRSYVMNSTLNYPAPEYQPVPAGFGMAVSLTQHWERDTIWPRFRGIRVTEVKGPGNKIWLAESHYQHNGAGVHSGSVYRDDGTWTPLPNTHGKISNFLFGDGHVESIDKFTTNSKSKWDTQL